VHGGVSDCDMEKGMVRCDVNVACGPLARRTGGDRDQKHEQLSAAPRAGMTSPRQIEVLKEGWQLIPIHPSFGTTFWPGITGREADQGTCAMIPYFPDPDLMPLLRMTPG